MSTSPTPTRKRGGQPGNHNARKHGLTPRPTSPEYRLDKLNHVDLTTEIQVLRQQLQRLNEAALAATSLAETVEIARVIALTASALARLIRAQVIVFSADTSESSFMQQWEALVDEVLEDVCKELTHPDSPSSDPQPDSPPAAHPPHRDEGSINVEAWQRFGDLMEKYPGDSPRRKKRY